MGLSLRGRGSADLPPQLFAAVARSGAGTVLSAAPDADTPGWLVATAFELAVVEPRLGADGVVVWSRPWHEVDAASWSRETSALTVMWVDGGRPGRWHLGDGAREKVFLQTLRERVQASVVLAEELSLSRRRTGRAVIRQDLRSRALLEQVVLGPGVRVDEEVRIAAAAALAALREQVGLGQP